MYSGLKQAEIYRTFKYLQKNLHVCGYAVTTTCLTDLDICRSTVSRACRWQPVLGWLTEILRHKPM